MYYFCKHQQPRKLTNKQRTTTTNNIKVCACNVINDNIIIIMWLINWYSSQIAKKQYTLS